MKRVTCTICLMLASLVSGCTTIMNGPTQDIVVTSNPPGATVTPTDYKCWIKTPGIIKLDRNQGTTLTARLYGYEDAKQKIKWGFSPWVFGNGVGSFLVGTVYNFAPVIALTIVDLSTGSAGVLSPNEVHFEMTKKGR